ncbi:condensation domain-containing protein, partial [Streptomyces sp. DH12]|uniref:condensation domain-containing protein n=1 Tax=Streptomyces sp. DH12 TaxID=2857010 RepID=UPI001E4554D2
ERVDGADEARPALTARPRPAVVPLSFAQYRLWFLHRMEGPGATYNIPMSLRLTGSLDTAALRAALADVVARHEALRTVYPERGGVPRQQVLDPVAPAFETVPTTPGRLEEDLTRAARRGFDLAGELPLRAVLFELGEREHVLLLLMHHIAGDGWSWPPLARDLGDAYAARREGRAPGFAPQLMETPAGPALAALLNVVSAAPAVSSELPGVKTMVASYRKKYPDSPVDS